MKLCLKILAVVIIAASTYSIIGCSAPAGYSYSNVSIALTVACSDCSRGLPLKPAFPSPATQGLVATTSAMPAGGGVEAVYGGNGEEGGALFFSLTVTNAPS